MTANLRRVPRQRIVLVAACPRVSPGALLLFVRDLRQAPTVTTNDVLLTDDLHVVMSPLVAHSPG